MADNINNPVHYTSNQSGIECIVIAEWLGFNLGNAFKYLYRFQKKNGIEDLQKAVWYLNNEVKFHEVNKVMSAMGFTTSQYLTANNSVAKIGLYLPPNIAKAMLHLIDYTQFGYVYWLDYAIKAIEIEINSPLDVKP